MKAAYPVKADIIDPALDGLPDTWHEFTIQHQLLPAWSGAALCAFARNSRRSTRFGIVSDANDVIALFMGDLATFQFGQASYAKPGRVSGIGWFDCRLILDFREGFAFSTELSASHRKQAVRVFERALRKHLGWHCFGIGYRSVSDGQLAAITERRRPRRIGSPNTVLTNRWETLNDYFDRLPRDRGRRFRRLHEQVSTSARVSRLSPQSRIDPLQASRLAHLTRLKYASSRTAIPPLPLDYFAEMNRLSSVVYFGHSDVRDNRLLSFDLTQQQGSRLITTVTGSTDSGQTGQRNLYFDLYLQEIAFAIENGLDGIEFGPGLASMKQQFGCDLSTTNQVFAPW